MRYLIPLVLVSSFGFVSCHKEAEVAVVDGGEEVQLEIAALRTELARLESQLVSDQNDRFRKDAEHAAIFSELAAVVKDLKEASKSQEEPEPFQTVGVPAVKEGEDFSEERRLARLKAEGEELAHLKTTSGDEYHELVINRVTDIGVVFRHRGGIARIPFAELPVAWQDRFYYDRDRALSALKSERVAQARHDRAVEAGLADLDGNEAKMEIERQLQALAAAVQGLQQQVAGPPAPGPVEVPVEDQIIVNPPIIVYDDTFVQDDFYCPPIIQSPIVRNPILKVPTIRPGNSGQLHKPQLHKPTPLRATSTIRNPGSRPAGTSTTTPRSRPSTTSSTPAPTTTIRRSSTNSGSRPTSAPVQRSRPAPTVRRQSTPAPVPRSSPSPSRPSRSVPSAPTNSRPTIRRR